MLISLQVYVVVGLAVINGGNAFAASYYAGLDRGWGPSPLDGQNIGGVVLAWAGNGLSVVFSMLLLVLWMREEGHRTRLADRAQDRLTARGRAEDTEPARYNAWLRSLEDQRE